MAKQAAFEVIAGGTPIGAILSPRLISLSVSDKAGTISDTASITIDDTDGRVSFPAIGAPLAVLLGWRGGGIREVFRGTVDEVTSAGSRGAGRTLSITGKGVDTTKEAKEPQQRHFDDSTIEDILRQAGEVAGISDLRVDPLLGQIERVYVEMRDESFLHLGERLAREIGGNFTVRGSTAFLTRRDAPYQPLVRAVAGDNLHSWSMTPATGRPMFSAVGARFYDLAAAAWQEITKETGLPVSARHWPRFPRADAAEAGDQADADRATTERDQAGGTVTIEGDTGAVPEGMCLLSGARPGVDGLYRINTVTHNLSRGGGFVTSMQIGAATEDSKNAAEGGSGARGPYLDADGNLRDEWRRDDPGPQ